VNCTKMRLAAGLRPDPLGSYGAETLWNLLAVIREEEGGKGKERVGNREGRKGREWMGVKG